MTDTTKDTKDEGKGRSAELKDALDAPAFVFAGYRESEDHVPDPFFQSGNLDTSDTAGTANNSIKEISPIFEVARVQNLRTAARALDPEDDGVGAELVTLPQGQVTVMGTTKSAEEGREDVVNAVLKAAENPPEVGGLSPAQKAAAEDTSGDAEESFESGKTPEKGTGNAQSALKVESKTTTPKVESK